MRKHAWILVAVVFLAACVPTTCLPCPTLEPTIETVIPLPTHTPMPTDTPSPSNVYAVAPTGDNANPGSPLAPWRTIQYAVDHVVAGDTIYVVAGTYMEAVSITRSGAAGAPITLRGEGVVIIDGGSQPAIRTTDADYWGLEDLTLISTSEATLQMSFWGCRPENCEGAAYWVVRRVHVYGETFHRGHHLLMEDCELDGLGTAQHGVYAWQAHHNTYRGNEVHHFRHSGIREQGMNHDTLIEGNYLHDIRGWGNVTITIAMDGHGNSEYNQTIRNNVIERVEGDCIQLENTFASLVEGNDLMRCQQIGIVVTGYAAPYCQENGGYGGEDCHNADFGVVIRNNTVTGNTATGWGPWAGLVSYSAGGLHYEGNVLDTVRGCAAFFQNPPGITWDDTNICNEQPYDFGDAYR